VANQKPNSGRGGDRKSVNYLLSLNSAKELAMIVRNAQGKAVRNYSIDGEKQLYLATLPTPPEDTQKVARMPKTEQGAGSRVVAGDSIVMSPAEFSG
jgi:phage anti-repressor protein